MEKMFELTHSRELYCACGYVLRRREWDKYGSDGCLENSCPHPTECKLKLRSIDRGNPNKVPE